MRHVRSDALILATYPLREKDRIVSMLTRDAGKKRGVARGSRNPKSAFSGTLEPMTEVSVLYFEKESRELVSINSADLLRSSFPLSRPLNLVHRGELNGVAREFVAFATSLEVHNLVTGQYFVPLAGR